MKKILLVNEFVDISNTLKSMMESDGYKVEQLFEPLNLFEKIDEFSPDLIILDIYFKYVDGLILLEKLFSIMKDSVIPVLIISSKNEPLFMIDSMERGAHDFLAFPFEKEQFLGKIKKIEGQNLNA